MSFVCLISIYYGNIIYLVYFLRIIIIYLFYIITAIPINVIAPAIFPVAGTLNGASAI